jgi:hypothetical protein
MLEKVVTVGSRAAKHSESKLLNKELLILLKVDPSWKFASLFIVSRSVS